MLLETNSDTDDQEDKETAGCFSGAILVSRISNPALHIFNRLLFIFSDAREQTPNCIFFLLPFKINDSLCFGVFDLQIFKRTR